MEKTPIFKALKISTQNLEDMIQGQSIIALPQVFITPGQQFALYPHQADSNPELILIKFWARCEFCQIIDDRSSFDILARLIMRSLGELINIFERKGALFLAYLRVYKLANSIEIPANQNNQFINLPETIYVSADSPILSDRDFARLKRQIENLEPPEPLDIQIVRMLEEAELQYKLESEKDLEWIERIASVGNSSDGHEFEKLVRKSFIALGFSNSNRNPKASLDPEATGGSGGIDLCCEHPYPVVGECKASANHKIPTEVCSQLTYLGQAHFPEYEKAIKIIIGAGSLNHHSNPIAISSKMNVIRPETIEKLVKLKTSYVGSINLWDLKLCLEREPFGEEANSKLVEFIEDSERTIKLEVDLRSHIIQIVKQCLERFNSTSVDLDSLSGAYHFSTPPQNLSKEELRDILIELSSPLVGYLGRVEENGKKVDRFYFLRDLLIE